MGPMLAVIAAVVVILSFVMLSYGVSCYPCRRCKSRLTYVTHNDAPHRDDWVHCWKCGYDTMMLHYFK
jgi:hypothetical protein